MMSLARKRILLGVSGGIAAYKSPDLVRRLRAAGAEVRVVMTAGARQFITPLTLQAVSAHPVYLDMFESAGSGMEHIDLARWADVVLIAPASADLIARLAHGMADDLLTTVCLATAAPLALAPAMNQQMWQHPATLENIDTLTRRGVKSFGPGEGDQACGEVGPGRMLEPRDVVTQLAGLWTQPELAGVGVLISAGPTLEAIDPVRYIGNRSSGRMGYALAAAAHAAGAEVVLVSGPTALPDPAGVHCIRVRSALEMRDAIFAHVPRARIFVSAAAVADYRPEAPASAKIKKSAERMTLTLVRNPDILADVAALRDAPFCVGFAAETEALEANARAKLKTKRLDMIIANPVGRDAEAAGTGFDAADNQADVYWPGGAHRLPRASKAALAQQLITLIAERFHESAKNPG